MMNFLSEVFFTTQVAETPKEKFELPVVENDYSTIDFDYSLAEVGTEVMSEAEVAQTADLNSYYQDLLKYICQDRGYNCDFNTVRTADRWDITMVRVSKPSVNLPTQNAMKQLFLLDSLNSDCTYWAHHNITYDLVEAGNSVWLGNTRFSKGFALSTYAKGTLNNVAVHDVPKQLAHILQKTGQSKVTVVTHGSGSSIMGYALGKYEESTFSFYNYFAYFAHVEKVIAIAPCAVTKVSPSPNDNLLMRYCDKIPWYVFAGTKDDVCTIQSVQTNIKVNLQMTNKLAQWTEFDIGHRLKKFEPLITNILLTIV